MAETKPTSSSVKGVVTGFVIGVIVALGISVVLVYFVGDRFEVTRDLAGFLTQLIDKVGAEGAVMFMSVLYAMSRDRAHGKRFDKLMTEFAKQRESDQKLIAQLAKKG